MKKNKIEKLLLMDSEGKVALLTYISKLESLTTSELDEYISIKDTQYFDKDPRGQRIIDEFAEIVKDCK